MEKDFKFNILLGSELIVSKSNEEAKSKYVVRSVASSVNEDRQGEKLSSLALKKMQNSAELNKIPIFSEHMHSWKNTMGYIGSSIIKDDNTWIIDTDLESPDFNADSALLINKMDHGTPINMSIGGRVLKSHLDKSGDSTVRVIDDLELFEVSFVGIPANKDASVISYIAKSFENMEEDTMTEKEIEEVEVTEEEVQEEPKKEVIEEVEAEPVVEEAEKSYATKKDLDALKSEIVLELSKQLNELKATKKNMVEDTDKGIVEDEEKAEEEAEKSLEAYLAKRIGLEE